MERAKWCSLALTAFCLFSAGYFFLFPSGAIGRQEEIDVGLKALACAAFFAAATRFFWRRRGYVPSCEDNRGNVL